MYISLPLRILAVVFMLAALNGCDAVTDEANPRSAESVPISSYVYDSGKTVRVVADPAYAPARRSFESLNAYHAYLEQLDAAGVITVNASLWERLRHANDPAEISVLDAAGTVVVGDFIYEVGPEAVYRTPVDEPDAEPELELYYGLTGDEDLKEFTRAALAYSGTVVDEAELKNPFAKEMIREAAALAEGGGMAAANGIEGSMGNDQARSACIDWYGSDSRHFGQCDVADTYIPFSMAGFLPSGYQTASGSYNTRVWMINQSYKKFLKKKAYAATQIQVRRSGSSDAYFGLSSICPVYNDYVDIPPYATNYKNMFEVRVRIEGSTSLREACFVSRDADRSGGSESNHWSWAYRVTTPGNGYHDLVLNEHFLD